MSVETVPPLQPTSVWLVLATVAALIVLPLLPLLRKKGLCSRLSDWWRGWREVDVKASLAEALYFEVAPQPTIAQLRDAARAQEELRPTLGVDFDRRLLPLGPNCEVTEGEICDMYRDQELAQKVVLVLKLCLSLLAYGHCSIDVESIAIRVSGARVADRRVGNHLVVVEVIVVCEGLPRRARVLEGLVLRGTCKL